MMMTSQVLAIPLNFDLISREFSNKMFGPSAYFWAHYFSGILSYMQYPVIYSVCAFWFFTFPDSSLENFMTFVGTNCLIAHCGIAFGFAMGTIMSNIQSVSIVVTFFMLLFGMGGGLLASIGPNTNFIIRFLSWVSPFRYGSELILRCVLTGIEPPGTEEFILNAINFNYG
jgi:hypothetical protein